MPISADDQRKYHEALSDLGEYQNGTWRRWSDLVMGVPWLVLVPALLFLGGAIGAHVFTIIAGLCSVAILGIVLGYRKVCLKLMGLHMAAIMAVPQDYKDEPWP